jgi:hypothetical protein
MNKSQEYNGEKGELHNISCKFAYGMLIKYVHKTLCAAKAFYSCPAIISRRPGSQDTPKESQLNSEEDSRRKQA